MVPRSGWQRRLLRFLHEQVEEFFTAKEAQVRQAAHAHAFDSGSERRCTMSAALTLPYVWATAINATATSTTATGTEPRESAAGKQAGGIVFYRRRTENLLRRYLRASLAVGRVPSVAADITLRGRMSSYQMKNFEDVVIFAIDVEKCLGVLGPRALKLVVKIAIQEYMFQDVAAQIGVDVRTVAKDYGRALDRLTEEFLKRNLLAEGN